jgi:opacity protein-like surface antigen
MRKGILVLAMAAVCTLAGQNAIAESDIGFHGVGARLGFVDPEGLDMTVSFGGFVNLGTVAQRVRIEPYLDYWSQSEGSFGTEASLRDFAFGARGLYNFPVSNPDLRPYAGAGLGLHFLKSKVSVPDMDLGGGVIIPGYTLEDSNTELGLDLGGGIATAVSPSTDLLAEAWYTVSDVELFAIRVGVEYKLGR